MRISDWSSNVCSSDLMPRRYPDYPNAFEHWNGIATHGYEIMAVGMVVFFINLIWSLAAGRKAADNPWGDGATTLEWTDRKSTRLTPVTNAHIVCRLLLEKKNITPKDKRKPHRHLSKVTTS